AEALTHSGAREALANVLRGVEDAYRRPSRARPPRVLDESRSLVDAEVAVVLDQLPFAPASTADAAADEDTSLQAILDHVKDAIMTVDTDGRVLGSNSAAARLFAIDEAELPGVPIAAFLPALDPP